MHIERNGLSRRDWIARMLGSAAGLQWMAAAGLGQEHRHEAIAGEKPAGNWTPEILSAEQNADLIAMGERIVPGSAAALCSRVIDRIVAVEEPKSREELVRSIGSLNEEAKTKFGRAFGELSGEQQDAVLTAASTGKGALRDAFEVVKGWMADTYWTSREGMKELGWTGRVAWDSFPGCEHRG